MLDFLIRDNFRGIHHLPFLLMLAKGGQKVSHLFTLTSKYINSFEKVNRKYTIKRSELSFGMLIFVIVVIGFKFFKD